MSRFSDYDDYEGEPEQILAYGRWQHNAQTALKGKRGRRALRELREALMALPEHRLIEGAMCTVGSDQRRAKAIADETARCAAFTGSYQPVPNLAVAEALARKVELHGEGVCGIGAYLWYQKVKAGADPHEAFASLPTVLDAEDENTLDETAYLGQDAGLTFTLAWELAYRNDETYRAMTPEERWSAFVAWIDQELAEPQAVTQ